ncbi:hypothetical protein SCA03_19210 [Streptomyces cacaoi]|uniref:Uncharacterized protein n=1 Tax=Streptomyces cacaoi TaxID=1898 RepID=A0A4Y3QZK2_STRCI|nr:hypothetical protein SCA03_19210 [Streptomyces cacaoi]
MGGGLGWVFGREVTSWDPPNKEPRPPSPPPPDLQKPYLAALLSSPCRSCVPSAAGHDETTGTSELTPPVPLLRRNRNNRRTQNGMGIAAPTQRHRQSRVGNPA